MKFGIATQIPQVPETSTAGGSGSQLCNSLSCSTPMKDLTSLTGDVYWLESNMIKHNGNVVKMNYSITPLERLVSGDKVKYTYLLVIISNHLKVRGSFEKTREINCLPFYIIMIFFFKFQLAVRRLHSDGSLRFLLNGEDCGIAVANVPKKLVPVVELYGSTLSVSVVSVSQMSHPSPIGSMAHR